MAVHNCLTGDAFRFWLTLTRPGYQLVFCFDVLGSLQDERQEPSAQLTVSTLGSLGDLAFKIRIGMYKRGIRRGKNTL
ncbi:hypothetical protein [Nostoc sp.]|uniref:hypothetical protein n=1 Tax=Nostoc sp. TaxID=1180 RepID=UPI003FA5DECA